MFLAHSPLPLCFASTLFQRLDGRALKQQQQRHRGERQQRLWRERPRKTQHQLSRCNSYDSDACLAPPAFSAVADVCLGLCFVGARQRKRGSRRESAARAELATASNRTISRSHLIVATTAHNSKPTSTTTLTLRKFNATLRSTERHTTHAYSCCSSSSSLQACSPSSPQPPPIPVTHKPTPKTASHEYYKNNLPLLRSIWPPQR